jgi:hypothetical protein
LEEIHSQVPKLILNSGDFRFRIFQDRTHAVDGGVGGLVEQVSCFRKELQLTCPQSGTCG